MILIMGVFDRLKRIVNANLNAFLDSVEDPERALEQAVHDMHRELAKARELLTEAMVNEKKMTRVLETEQVELDQLRQRAASLLQAGNEALAKELLVRHRTAKELLESKGKELFDQRRLVTNLKALVDDMGRKIEEAKQKKVELATRVKLVKSGAHGSTTPGLAAPGAFNEFDRFVGKIEDDELRSQVARELSGAQVEEDILKTQKHQDHSSADEELEKLKREMGLAEKKEG